MSEPRLYLDRLPTISGGIGQGWVPIVQRLVDDLDALARGWVPVQIKEKFGALCLYANPPVGFDPDLDPVFAERIRATERLSACLCDVCGDPGRIRNLSGQHASRCDAHATKYAPDGSWWPDAELVVRDGST